MDKIRIIIDITVNEHAFLGGRDYTHANVLAYETAIEKALHSELTCYDPVVYATMDCFDSVIDIDGLDLDDPYQKAVHSKILALLNDHDFMNDAWAKAWR